MYSFFQLLKLIVAICKHIFSFLRQKIYTYMLVDVYFSLISFCQRAEIVQWINQGGGEVISEQTKQRVNFTIELHGVTPRLTGDYESTYISSHWIRSCLKVSPTNGKCKSPFSGLSVFIFCILRCSMGYRSL